MTQAAEQQEKSGDGRVTRPMNGEEYLDSLRDGREIWIYGERVDDVTRHPAFRNGARSVARLYDGLAARDLRPRIFARVQEEWEKTERAILRAASQSVLLENSPVLRRSIRLRNPYVDPLSFVQVSLLARLRRLDPQAPPAEELRRLAALSVNGVAAAVHGTTNVTATPSPSTTTGTATSNHGSSCRISPRTIQRSPLRSATTSWSESCAAPGRSTHCANHSASVSPLSASNAERTSSQPACWNRFAS